MATALDVAITAPTGTGARTCSTVPGESPTPLVDAVDRDPGLRLLSPRDQSIAVLVAEARTEFTGVPTVVTATRGVTATDASVGCSHRPAALHARQISLSANLHQLLKPGSPAPDK